MEMLFPAVGHGPGVVVAHAWWGLNQTIRDYGAALAERGFVVGLPDLFDGKVTDQIAEAERFSQTDWPVPPSARLVRAVGELAAHAQVDGGGVGAVGFSYSGYHLLGLRSDPSLPLRRLVIYYATRKLVPSPVATLMHFAADDAFESADDMRAMTMALADAGPPNAAYSYAGTRHWFAESDRPEYDAGAAQLAFTRTMDFLRV
jgi:carboxymethylenebutenolidase